MIRHESIPSAPHLGFSFNREFTLQSFSNHSDLMENLIHSSAMKRILELFLFALLLPLFPFWSFGQNTDIMMQGFNWESHSNSGPWYNVINSKAAELGSAGIGMIWMPPPSDAGSPQGYLPRKLYDVSTNYGSEAQLQTAINALHSNGVKVLADIVINHRVGVTNWADFQQPTWGCWGVTSNDEWGQNGGNPCGGYDTGENYHAARDIDHTNSTVRNDLIAWMNWLKGTIGFDGWRYDYVRGYNGYYNGLYDNATSSYFSVGELWDNLDLNNVNAHRQQIVDWIDDTGGVTSAFDFTTKGVLQQAVNGEYWRLSIGGGAPGVIGWFPGKSVTFIDNHDTGSTQNYWPFPGSKVMQGYAYILTHPGVPCVFWDHYFDWGLKNDINELMEIRKDAGIHSTSTLDIKAAQGNLYAAEIDDKVAMKIGPGSWSPSGNDWTLAASGTDYAVWTKGSTNCSGGLTIHYKKPTNWNSSTLYFWGTTPVGGSTSWPGAQMQSEGNGWYAYTIPCVSCANIIFSDNGANQTVDLYRCNEGWYDGSWHNSNPDNSPSTDLTVHYKPATYSNPEIYFWNVTPTGASTTWPGVTMQSEGNGYYKYTFTGASCANFIFSNGGGGQSPDLNSCTEVWYTEGNWGSSKADFSEDLIDGESLEVTVYPVPARDVLYLQLRGGLDLSADLEVYDMKGQKLFSRRVIPGVREELDIHELTEGIHFYRVTQGERVCSGKIQIVR